MTTGAESTDARGLRQHADAIFTRLSPYEGQGLRNHCLRIHRFATMLYAQDGIEADGDLTYLLALVHDLGLVTDAHGGRNYMERTRNLFRHEARALGLGLSARELELADECLLLNHRLLTPPGATAEAEGFRRAVWVEHSGGVLRSGLDRDAVAAVRRELPRDNFDRVLLDFTRRVVLREPQTLVRGIFF